MTQESMSDDEVGEQDLARDGEFNETDSSLWRRGIQRAVTTRRKRQRGASKRQASAAPVHCVAINTVIISN